MNCLFSQASLHGFFSKEGNKPARSKLEETEKMHTPKNGQNLRSFLVFPNYVKQFIPNYSNLNTLTHPLMELLQKKADFDWTGSCNEAFGKLKLCMNNDTSLSYFDKSIRI